MAALSGFLDHNISTYVKGTAGSLPTINALLETTTVTTAKVHLEWLATFLIRERPPLIIFPDTPSPYIRLLWGTEFVDPSYLSPTQKYGKVLLFVIFVLDRKLLITIEVLVNYIKVGQVIVTNAA